MKGPQQFTGSHIETAYVPFCIELGPRPTTCPVCRPYHNDVIHDKGRRRNADIGVGISGVIAISDAYIQIDDAVIAKVRIRNAGLGIQ